MAALRRSLTPLALALLLLAISMRSPAVHGQKDAVFSYGVACGEPSSTVAVLWTRTSSATTIVPELLDPNTGEVLRQLPAVATRREHDFTLKVVADGLLPNEALAYRFRSLSGEVSATGSCRTAPARDDAAAVTFGFSGDADWKWKPYPLLNALNRESLNFFIFLGDLLYETTNLEGTTAVEDLAGYRAKYRENREPVGDKTGADVPLRTLYQSFGMYAVFDNHETGPSKLDPTAPPYNEGGASAGDGVHQYVNQTPGYHDRIQAYSEYTPVHDRMVSGTGDPRMDGTAGFYYTQRWGKSAELFVTDDRSYRDSRLKNSDDPAANSADRTMLGRPQLQWLEQELATAQRSGVTWKFVVVSSPVQQIGRASQIGVDLDGSKSWAGGYTFERDQLLQYIAGSGIHNVVFLTTDNHNTMINNLSYHATPGDPASPLLPAGNAFEILTGPMGAGTGLPGVKADVAGLSGRAIDRRVSETLSGDRPNSDGVNRGQKQGGVDPLGLEPDFPGLVLSSIVGPDGTTGVAEPAAFGAYNTYAYAVLTATDTTLSVRIAGIPAVVDPTALTNDAGLQAYQSEQLQPLVQFQVRAQ